MINFVVTKDHRYPFIKLLSGMVGFIPFKWRQWSYEELLKTPQIPTGTWIFQDIERLTDWERISSSKIATALMSNGAIVLNHPGRSAARYELQRRLCAAKINQFQVYRADEYRVPQRWPVFIRFENDHNSPDPKLIDTSDELNQALAVYRKNSIPISTLMVVEYCGEPFEDGLWRKFSAYRVGSNIIHHHIVKQDSWVAKQGNPALDFSSMDWTRLRSEEKGFVEQTTDPHNLLQAFECGNIEFGRIDFSFVKGAIQVYEINTNPSLHPMQAQDDKFPSFPRAAICQVANDRIIAGLHAMDSEANRKVDIYRIILGAKRP